MPQPLLIPLDGSDVAEAALPWAKRLAAIHGLPLVLLRATGSAQSGVPLSGDVNEQGLTPEGRAATIYLAGNANELRTQGVTVESIVRAGAPAEVILDAADERAPFAIVMATHGRGGVKRLLLGSVTEAIVQRSLAPILLVRKHESNARASVALERLVIPLDGSALSELALDHAMAIAQPGATLLLSRVVVPVETVMMVGSRAHITIDEVATRAAATEAADYLNLIIERVRTAGFAAEARVCRGQAAEQILLTARDLHADLIVMTTHGRTGHQRWRLGSVADALVREADQPVLLVSVRTLAAQRMGQFTVGDVMTRTVTALHSDESVSVALRKLLRNRISSAPVVNDTGNPIGIVSGHDLLTWQAGTAEALASEAGTAPGTYARRMDSDTVAQIMSPTVVTLEETAALSAAARLFLQRNLRSVPVTRDHHLVGVLSRMDLLRAMAQQWQGDDHSERAEPGMN